MKYSRSIQSETDQDRLGHNIAARLAESVDQLPHDISERLKAARMQALLKRKVVKLQAGMIASTRGGVVTLHFGGDGRGLWNRIASFIPLVALVAGLISIAILAEEARTNELAEIDAELLTDELPPDAYTDPGFAQFLRVNNRE